MYLWDRDLNYIQAPDMALGDVLPTDIGWRVNQVYADTVGATVVPAALWANAGIKVPPVVALDLKCPSISII